MEFANVAELLAAALDQRPHLIMLNLFMPGMNGWEALARLRTDPRVAEIPVVDTSMLSPDESESAYIDLSGWSHKPREEAEPLPGVTGALGSGARPRRMLIVEDDADVARVIASSFERSGLEVIVASNGQQAINLAATLVPDLVILDLQLPEVDGFGVVDWIKDHDLWRSVPLIVYSARETTPAQQEQLRLGPTEFIIKSRIGPEEFERRVFNLLDQLSETKPPVPETLVAFESPKRLVATLGDTGQRMAELNRNLFIYPNLFLMDNNATALRVIEPTAADMLELIEKIKSTAREKRGIELETEVQIVGEPA